jgi:hypothetical protein
MLEKLEKLEKSKISMAYSWKKLEIDFGKLEFF